MIPYLLSKKKVVNYFDYFLILGQSNMDGRAALTGFDDTYKLGNSNFKLFTTTINDYLPPANAAWSWVFMHEIAKIYPTKPLVSIRVTLGGTACHTGGRWNIITGDLLTTTLSRIRAIKDYAINLGKIPRCTGILWDQKESDVTYTTYVQYIDGQLQGDFVDTINAIKLATGDDPWLIFAELMTSQANGTVADENAMIAMQRLYAQHTSKAYLLPMEINQANIPTADNLHYNAVGTTFVGLMARDILVNNNLTI